MAQEQSVEAARARIQRLVDEITALSRREMRSEDYFQEFLVRVVQATDGRGGAVWLVAQRPQDGKSEFQLVAQVELESALFHTDEAQHGFLTRQLAETVQRKAPVVTPPMPVAPEPGSLQAQLQAIQGNQPVAPANRTPFPFFHIPLLLKEQVVGVLQVWLQPYVVAANYPEFVTFLQTLSAQVEQHLHTRRTGNLVMENQRLQQVLKFASDVAGSLDPLEVGRLASNYGRDLLSCERCSVLARHGDRWSVLSISGQEIVEKKSSMVKAMAAFVGIHAQPAAFKRTEADPATGSLQPRHELLVLSKKELLARAEASTNGSALATAGEHAPRRTDEIDLDYFEHSHVVSALIAPMYDAENELVGAFFAESTTEGFFDTPAAGKEASSGQRLAEWLAIHTGKALVAAGQYRSLPFLAVTSRMRDARLAVTGQKRKRVLTRLIVGGVILLAVALYPKADLVDGNCALNPQSRAAVVPEVAGRVDRILVREGAAVKKGDPIAQLDTSRLEIDRESARQERTRLLGEADRLRGLGDEAQAQTVALQASIAEKREQILNQDIASATLRSAIDGVVLTKDLELHTGEFIQAGTVLAEIADSSRWDLLIEVNEKKIGAVEQALGKKKQLPVDYILYSQSTRKLRETLQGPQQISAMAYPREKENVFIITLPSIDVPAEWKNELRPGLTGRAKVALGHEPLAWWFIQNVVDWVRLKIVH